MFTIEEYAIAANDAYRDRSISAHMANVDLQKYQLTPIELDHHLFPPGFFARLYYSKFRRGYILAFRGTTLDAGPIKADAQYTFEDKKPDAYYWAEELFYRLLVKKPELNYQLCLTGHSLGGLFAKLITVESGFTSVGFNAPGIERLVRAVPKGIPITNINAMMDLVSHLYHQVGNIINLVISSDLATCGTNLPLCLYEEHRMANIIDALKYNPKVASLLV